MTSHIFSTDDKDARETDPGPPVGQRGLDKFMIISKTTRDMAPRRITSVVHDSFCWRLVHLDIVDKRQAGRNDGLVAHECSFLVKLCEGIRESLVLVARVLPTLRTLPGPATSRVSQETRHGLCTHCQILNAFSGDIEKGSKEPAP